LNEKINEIKDMHAAEIKEIHATMNKILERLPKQDKQ
jgi:hypothetical protein